MYESAERAGLSGSNESSTREDSPRGVCAASMAVLEMTEPRRAPGGDCSWPCTRPSDESSPNAADDAIARGPFMSWVLCACSSRSPWPPHAEVLSGAAAASVGAIEKSMYWNGDESSSSIPVEAGGEAALRMLSTSP